MGLFQEGNASQILVQLKMKKRYIKSWKSSLVNIHWSTSRRECCRDISAIKDEEALYQKLKNVSRKHTIVYFKKGMLPRLLSPIKFAISCAMTAPSSTSVQGRHMQSTGARVVTFRSWGSPGLAWGHLRLTVASLSPDSWQHMQERSRCQTLLPETWT